jgi:hypothetical protein
LRLGTLVSMNIEVPTKYSLSQDRIVVFEIRLQSKSPMLYRPTLHGNWNALSLARGALKDKFPTPTVPVTTVLQNRRVFLPDPVYIYIYTYIYNFIWRHKNFWPGEYNNILMCSVWQPTKVTNVLLHCIKWFVFGKKETTCFSKVKINPYPANVECRVNSY